uniref:Uncharacterized protein n=1 Tax=Anopheles culicifacies TaxID=139723 RepID=A0A182M289_9DIPT
MLRSDCVLISHFFHDRSSDGNAKKGLKSNKDSRINIKIFLGQTVQQDSSDTGISDTEGATPTTVAGTNTSRPIASYPKQEPSITNMVGLAAWKVGYLSSCQLLFDSTDDSVSQRSQSAPELHTVPFPQ